MAKSGLEFQGLDRVARAIQALADETPDRVGDALEQEAHLIATDSKKRTPVDTGALRASHEVSRPQHRGREVTVEIGVGGPAAPYALHVHENMAARHSVGEAKFLERAVSAAVRGMDGRIAERVGLGRG